MYGGSLISFCLEYTFPATTPEVKKAKRVLGFEALTTLEDALDEIIPWVSDQVKKGLI